MMRAGSAVLFVVVLALAVVAAGKVLATTTTKRTGGAGPGAGGVGGGVGSDNNNETRGVGTPVSSGSSWSPAQCREAGFLEGLICSDCELSAEHLDIPGFKDTCLRCCEAVEGVDAATVKYPKAVLEMCNCKLRAFPQIEPFVTGRMKNAFKNMKHKHINGAPPRLKLMDKKGKVVEVLNIEKWDTDTVTAFLEERLEA
ncbi:hypothetical protein PTSG_08285 [Salpingoeca rosetta]|uniref:Selenoprotein F n=1 Tax=Salpingoeca rosetta (strain ATCC 50818 / BSB-021) TaxID=946362 RepID=F2UJ93_SALR5|nr:uncharacterized protein PTSG_08285 [Salpingoeca rosetta]EGD77192.1 hypothetical protein PTSG_08285 [Salpingoeca rosetta]|eukprot:XP_004990536.1 hypothetical protein PTSG_08285 [Salpingoeca rosetta]